MGEPQAAAPVAMAVSQPAESIVYFDFDESVIKAEWRDLLSSHAKYLLANPEINLILEGHCDERGTREYNIALGERRAKAVKRFLASKGLEDSRLEIVSFGEEKPAEAGHDEAAWAKNRRVEVKYK